MSQEPASKDFKGQHLEVTYTRLCPSDKGGMLEIVADGAEKWTYIDIGPHYGGVQWIEKGDRPKADEFASELAKLVRKYFNVPPVLDTDVGKRKKKR